jgi:cephalosporin-C deacetylase
MQVYSFRFVAPLLAILLVFHAAHAQEIAITPSKPMGIYKLGEKASWRLHVRERGTNSAKEIRYILKKNGLTVYRQGVLPIENSVATLEATMDKPGTILAELKVRLADREIAALAGAVFGPERIAPSEERPADFDTFWNTKVAELRKIPVNPMIEAAASGRPAVNYYKIRMDNIQGSHIYGQLAMPKRTGKFPALIILQWAGVYPLQRDWVIWRAEAGWLTLNIMAHDMPFDHQQTFYDERNRTTHADYHTHGNEDREKSTFLRMYLSCYRAAEYLTERPEWDGRTLIVMGASQGGMQTIVTAAMHPKVTAGLVDAPAGCDMNGPVAGRAPGWPMWYWQTQGKDPERVRNTGRYFDAVNFAPRVKCPILVVLDLLDTTCPASGIYAMINQLQGPKEVVATMQGGHGGSHETYSRRSEAWLTAFLKSGRPPIGSLPSPL